MRRLSQKVQLHIRDTSLSDSVEGQYAIVFIKFLVFFPKTLVRHEKLADSPHE